MGAPFSKSCDSLEEACDPAAPAFVPERVRLGPHRHPEGRRRGSLPQSQALARGTSGGSSLKPVSSRLLCVNFDLAWAWQGPEPSHLLQDKGTYRP